MDGDLLTRLGGLAPLSDLSEVRLREIAEAGDTESFPPGAVIFREGEPDDVVYYVIAGTVDAWLGGERVRTLSASRPEASSPLAPGSPRPLTMRAAGPVTVFRVPADALARAQRREAFNDEAVATEPADTAWMTQILHSELFRKIPPASAQKIFSLMERVDVASGDVVIQQDTPGDYYFFIRSGSCEVTRTVRPNAPHIRLAELGPGQSFGEEALVSDGRRNASVRMLTDGRLMRLSRHDFIELIRKPALHSVSYAQAQSLAAKGAVWLDVRLPEEHEQSGIEGSINIPLDELRTFADGLMRDTRYIVYCDTGRESSAAAFLLTEMGLDVCYLSGGLIHTLTQLRSAPPGAAPEIPEVPPLEPRGQKLETVEDAHTFLAALEADADGDAGRSPGDEEDLDLPDEGRRDAASAQRPPNAVPARPSDATARRKASRGEDELRLAPLLAQLAEVKTQLLAAMQLKTLAEQARAAAEEALASERGAAHETLSRETVRADGLAAPPAATPGGEDERFLAAEARARAAESELEDLVTELSEAKVRAHVDADAYDKAMQLRIFEERRRADAAERSARESIERLELQRHELDTLRQELVAGLQETHDGRDSVRRAHESELERALGERESALADARREIGRLTAAAAAAREAHAARESELARTLAELRSQGEEQRAARAAQASELETARAEVDAGLAALERERAEARAARFAAEQLADRLRSELDDRSTELTAALARIESDRVDAARRTDALRAELDAVRSSKVDLDRERQQALAAREASEKELAKIEPRLADLRGTVASLQNGFREREDAWKTERSALRERLGAARSEIDSARSARAAWGLEQERMEQRLLEREIVIEAERAKHAAELDRVQRLRDDAAQRLRQERRAMAIEAKEVDQQLQLALRLRSEAEAAMQAAVQLVKERGLEPVAAQRPVSLVEPRGRRRPPE